MHEWLRTSFETQRILFYELKLRTKQNLFFLIIKQLKQLKVTFNKCVMQFFMFSTETCFRRINYKLINNYSYTHNAWGKREIRGLPFIFRDLATLMLKFANWQLYRKAWHFWRYTYSKCFDIRALFVLFTVT